jgi:hypothetical protein
MRTILLTTSLLIATAHAAHAAALNWGRTVTVAKNLPICLGLGQRAFERLNATEFTKMPDHLTAKIGNAFVVYTCVDTKPRTTAIIIVMSDDAGEAGRARDAMQTELSKEKPQ